MTIASSLPPRETRNKRPRLKVRTQVQDILNYPTETVSIDYYGFAHHNKDGTEMTIPPHTILLFVPGNPGCIQWYIQLLYGLVSSLGIGFAARGVSYAGHGVSDAIANVQQYDTDESNNTSKRDTRIPWTVDGQMDHKMEWIDMIIHELKNEFPRQEPPRFIFLTHSIGAHLVQRLLVIRSDVLIRTILILHLMPFMRMDAPKPQQTILSAISRHPHQVIFIAQLLSQACKRLPNSYLNSWMKRSIQDMNAREFSVSLLQQPHMARNFFTLGCQEIRDLPQQPDIWAMRLIGEHCPTEILFCGNDHWSPEFHMKDLFKLQTQGMAPLNIYYTISQDLRHDFVVLPEMVADVKAYCLDCILKTTRNAANMTTMPVSRL